MITLDAKDIMHQTLLKGFLKKIKTDILNIDGGCYCCIKEFCDGVNETLAEYGLKIETDGEKLDVVEI